jgi:hypothetical protein
MRKPTEAEIQELCRVIYEKPGGEKWDYMIKIAASPLLKKTIRGSALRVWTWLQTKGYSSRIKTSPSKAAPSRTPKDPADEFL